MTITVDTSVWLPMLADKSGKVAAAIRAAAGDEPLVMSPLVRMELLQGCRGDTHWNIVSGRLDVVPLLSISPDTWDLAARLYFDLRQNGATVHSAVDCCIAQLALMHDCTLIHNDRDFEVIAAIRPLKHRRLDLSKV